MSDERVDKAREIGAAIKAPLTGPSTEGEVWPVAQELHELNSSFAFVDFWSRPGLDRKTRSLITVAILAALNRTDQLRIHVNGALNHGATPDELFEVIGHTGVYAGLPASSTGLSVVKEVLAQRDLHPPRT